MAIFGYVRKTLNSDGPPRIGIGAATRIQFGIGSFIGLFFGFACIDLMIRLAIEFLK